MLRAAVLADGDPTDIGVWSGIPANMIERLAAHFDLTHVERMPLSPRFRTLQQRLWWRSSARFDLVWSRAAVRVGANAALRRLRRMAPDVVIVVSHSPLCRLVARRHWTINLGDATGAKMVGYYPDFDRLLPMQRRALVSISAEAVRRSALNSYPSAWACRSAIEDCGAAPERVAEIAWGNNLRPPPVGRARTLHGPLRLLFVGIDWARKGGDEVVEAVRMLRARGVDVELDAVGVTPAGASSEPAIRFHGRLDKAKAGDAALLAGLYEQAHLFVMPSRQECFGIVFAEAAAHGLPLIARATGGVPSAVRDAETGLLLPEQAGAPALAEAIAGLVAEPARYAAMSRAALEDAAARLDWAVWAQRLHEAAVPLWEQDTAPGGAWHRRLGMKRVNK